MRKIVKVFHPRFETSKACKKVLKEYPDYEVFIHTDIDFDPSEERKLLLETDQLVILFPMYVYAAPYNYKYWIEQFDFIKDYDHLNVWIHTTVSGTKEWYLRHEPCLPEEFLKPMVRTWSQIMRANLLGVKVEYFPPKHTKESLKKLLKDI